MDMDVSVWVDRSLGLKITKRLPCGSTIGTLKQELVSDDIFGRTRIDDIILVASRAASPLGNDLEITASIGDLEIWDPVRADAAEPDAAEVDADAAASHGGREPSSAEADAEAEEDCSGRHSEEEDAWNSEPRDGEEPAPADPDLLHSEVDAAAWYRACLSASPFRAPPTAEEPAPTEPDGLQSEGEAESWHRVRLLASPFRAPSSGEEPAPEEHACRAPSPSCSSHKCQEAPSDPEQHDAEDVATEPDPEQAPNAEPQQPDLPAQCAPLGRERARAESGGIDDAQDGAPEIVRKEMARLQARFQHPLPPQAHWWSRLEVMIYLQSRGSIRPEKLAPYRRSPPPSVPDCQDDSPVSCRVSIVVPTTESRQVFHEQLWATFLAQEWPDKELVVFETYRRKPSPFFTELSNKADAPENLVFVSWKVNRGVEDMSIGAKRNICTAVASGHLIANFDDDDLYAPTYLQTMIGSMQEQENEAITLSSWYVYDCDTGRFGHFYPLTACHKDDHQTADGWLFGYGFSYVFVRKLAVELPYPDNSFAEDWEFFTAIRQQYTRRTSPGKRHELLDLAGVALLQDRFGLVLHTLHRGSTSDTVGQTAVSEKEVAALEFQQLGPILANHLKRFPPRRSLRFVRDSVQCRQRQVRVNSSFKEFRLRVDIGATARELQRLIARKVGDVESKLLINLYYTHPEAGERVPRGDPLEPDHIVSLRADELWATFPDAEGPTLVRVHDVPDFTITTTVQVFRHDPTVGDVVDQLLQSFARGYHQFGGLKLAKLEDYCKFVCLSSATKLGYDRIFFARELAELLGRDREDCDRDILSRIREEMSTRREQIAQLEDLGLHTLA